MRLFERNKFISVAAVVGLALFLGKGACDSICPDGITNITASSGVLAYPSSGDYGINETKCWRIEVPETYEDIYYYYNRYDIEVCESCKCDGIQVVRSSWYSFLLSLPKSCKRYSDNYLEARRLLKNPVDGPSPFGTNIYVRFVSDDTVQRKGFNFSFIAESNSGGDRSYLNASEDETIEFGTPKVGIQNYPESYSQQWFLFVAEGRQIQIDFDIFELEKSENCKNDYVEFREIGTTGPILTGRLCGSSKPSSIQSSGNVVWVQFKSDSNATTVYKGFKASFKAGQGRLFVSNPLTLLLLSALLIIVSKNSVF